MSTKSFTTKTGYYNNSQKKTTFTDKKSPSSFNKSKTKFNNKSSNTTTTHFYPVSDPIDYSNIQNKFDSKMLSQPILNSKSNRIRISFIFPGKNEIKIITI